MGKRSPSEPETPDPTKTAAAQGAANKEAAIATARLNQLNETTPYGRSYYQPTGKTADGIEQYERISELDPQSQANLDRQRAIAGQLLGIGEGQMGRIGENFARELDFSGLPAAPGADAGERKRIEDQLYGSYTSRLDPRFETEQTRLETQLANQGITRGTDAWNKAMDQFGRTRTDAYQQALANAVASGGAEESRQFGLGSTARQNALTETLMQRNQPLNELATLLGTSPQVSTPSFAPAPTAGIAPADIAGPTALAYQGQMNAYNQANNANNSFMNSLFNLGGSLGSAAILSDPAAKTDRAPVDEDSVLRMVESLPVESWRYKGGGGRHIGPMADEFAERFGGDGKSISVPTIFGVSIASIQELADRVKRLEGRA